MTDYYPKFGIIATHSTQKPRLPLIKDKNISELHKSSIVPLDNFFSKIDSLEYYQNNWQSMLIQEIGCCECQHCLDERENVIAMLELEQSWL